MHTNRTNAYDRHDQRKPFVLLVEDDENDVLLVRRVLKQRDSETRLLTARDGSEALGILRSEDYGGHPKVVVTDLNMPGMSGHDLIEAIRSDPALQKTVVFVLSSSDLTGDIDRAYQYNIAGYLTKSKTMAELSKNLEMIFDYCDAVELP